MILVYAQGGGLGHLNRARAFLETQKLLDTHWCLMTASPWAHFVFPEHLDKIIHVPANYAQQVADYQGWLKGQIHGLEIREVIIDTFPCGLLGEWNLDQNFPGKKLSYTYLARALKWNAYQELITHPPYFRLSYRLENLCTDQEDFIGANSLEQKNLPLELAQAYLSKDDETKLRELARASDELWLIVHSGPKEEVLTLLDYALDCARMENKKPQIALICPSDLSLASDVKLIQLKIYPAHLCLSWAQRVFTGGGFNCMWEVAQYPIMHYPYPFLRRYDDQFRRVQGYRKQAKL